MTQNKQSITKKVESKITKARKTPKITTAMYKKEHDELVIAEERIATLTLAEDVRMSVLIVSVLINLFFLIAWVMMQVTTQYDYAVSAVIFGR